VERERLATANALETLSYTVVGVIEPPLAGLLAPQGQATQSPFSVVAPRRPADKPRSVPMVGG
jgi:hypothetical protein